MERLYDLQYKDRPLADYLASIAIVVLLCWGLFLSAPKLEHGFYIIEKGTTLSSVAQELKDQGFIRSPFLFKSFTYLFTFGSGTIRAGTYAFPNSNNVITLAWRFVQGDVRLTPIRITFPEGWNSYEMAGLLKNTLPDFDSGNFLALVETGKHEGYLFPDTYFFLPTDTPESVIRVMRKNFDIKIASLAPEIERFGKSLTDIIKMASILEGEARTDETRRIVAGILWDRISIGMALQVDASFKYINGKTSATLTLEDLRADSPYNSYTRRGLPPTPISNPGLSSIRAAIEPTKTPYLYFLTDKDGIMRYARTFDEHVANKAKYLR